MPIDPYAATHIGRTTRQRGPEADFDNLLRCRDSLFIGRGHGGSRFAPFHRNTHISKNASGAIIATIARCLVTMCEFFHPGGMHRGFKPFHSLKRAGFG